MPNLTPSRHISTPLSEQEVGLRPHHADSRGTQARRPSGGAAGTTTTSAEPSRRCRWRKRERGISQRMVSERASQRAFFGVSALLFAASVAATIVWCGSMPAMGGMPMPGGWTMSMAWMRMPRQTWSVPRRLSSDVDGDDGRDDAAIPGTHAVALPPGRWQDRRDAPGSAHRAGGRGVLPGVDRIWNGRLSGWASHWRRSRCSSRRWRASYRSRSAWWS